MRSKLVLYSIVSAWALCAGVTAAARAELPPLVPREVLFGDSQKDWPQISPDGQRLAYLAPSEQDKVNNIWVRTLGKSDDAILTHDSRQGIGFYKWAYDSQHILYLQVATATRTCTSIPPTWRARWCAT